ncbi:MAG: MBL fold metallo-hydrolase [Deltaproteobacteria bacterium]|nr:MBL fold metallo-hydrolase [Deltaproteobacteria bacterium]MDQ3301381.1 MBL fold metallo-hydrolase [Myxococcota bacterium]
MQITFWGVRGSYPVPGAATVRYGGQTSCVEARSASGETVIVDAGTGLRALGNKLLRAATAPGHYHILLSHVHWDHIQGLPFFSPVYVAGTRISIYGLLTAADELHQVIGGITRHEFFPMALESVPAQFEFHEVNPGIEFEVGSFRVMPIALNHPFGSVGYRLDCDGTAWAYISDTAPFDQVLHKQHFLKGPEPLSQVDRSALSVMREALIQKLAGVDTVVYDTHFTPDEYERFPHYGHSTPDQALEVCVAAKVRRLVLYHHAPSHSDEQMDRIAAEYLAKGALVGIEVLTSFEGMTLPIGAATDAGAKPVDRPPGGAGAGGREEAGKGPS